jgi:hypothetical protein
MHTVSQKERPAVAAFLLEHDNSKNSGTGKMASRFKDI